MRQSLLTRLENDPNAGAKSCELQEDVRLGRIAPSVAAEQVVDSFLGPREKFRRKNRNCLDNWSFCTFFSEIFYQRWKRQKG